MNKIYKKYKKNIKKISISLATCLLSINALQGIASGTTNPNPNPNIDNLDKIKHIIIIYAENRSFDNLYGLFPNANGIKNASMESKLQINHDGSILPYLPNVWNDKHNIYPSKLENKPFLIDDFTKSELANTPDLVHEFYQNREQINGGKNNKFASVSDAGALSMGYYDGLNLKMWKWAKEYILADNFFMGAFGGSFINHQYLICACVPKLEHTPEHLKAKLDENGNLLRKKESPASALDGASKFMKYKTTPDGFVVNTMQPPYQPSWIKPKINADLAFADEKNDNTLPPQTSITIGDTLSEKNISWSWYADGWNAALKDGMQEPDKKRNVIYNEDKDSINFQPHHQPFNYYKRFAPYTKDREMFLKDGSDFMQDIKNNTLPAVSFYKPAGHVNQHPHYADILSGDKHISDIIDNIHNSKLWNDSLIIVTYDENGGFWDHVAPPKGDYFGPATRIPTILISPWVKLKTIDNTSYDTTSILKFITKKFNLTPLLGVRENAGDLTNALDINKLSNDKCKVINKVVECKY